MFREVGNFLCCIAEHSDDVDHCVIPAMLTILQETSVIPAMLTTPRNGGFVQRHSGMMTTFPQDVNRHSGDVDHLLQTVSVIVCFAAFHQKTALTWLDKRLT